MKREVRRIERPLNDADRQRYDSIRTQLEAEKDEIIWRGRQLRAASESVSVELRHAVEQLKAERLAKGLTLNDIETRSGIGGTALARLEEGLNSHPSLATVACYAEALGKHVSVSLFDTATVG